MTAGLAAVGAAAFALRPFGIAHPTTVALSFLMIVLFVATAGPLWAALATSIAAMLCFNFFFLPPVGTWAVAGPENWVALIALLVTSVVASQLSARARARAEEAGARRREAEIARGRAELSAALLAAISHDLRTPLTALRVAVANLGDGAIDAASRAEQAALAASQAERLTRLFDGILDMARIESNMVQAHRGWCAPAEIVDAALAHAGPALGRHAVDLTVDQDIEVNVDPRLTAAALSHLLENAAQYAPPGTRIHVRASADSDGLRLSVADEGPGLDEAEIEHLFTPLFRGRAGRSQAAGTGMGLAITRGLVAAQGGRAWAGNGPAGGASFAIAIPSASRTSSSSQAAPA